VKKPPRKDDLPRKLPSFISHSSRRGTTTKQTKTFAFQRVRLKNVIALSAEKASTKGRLSKKTTFLYFPLFKERNNHETNKNLGLSMGEVKKCDCFVG